jgi:hypothetical protein
MRSARECLAQYIAYPHAFPLTIPPGIRSELRGVVTTQTGYTVGLQEKMIMTGYHIANYDWDSRPDASIASSRLITCASCVLS